MEKLYTQRLVNRIFKHIPSSTLLHWAKMDVISWSGEAQDRRGVHRLYTLEDLYIIGLVEELTGLNFPLEMIRKSVTKLHFRRPQDEGKKDLIPLPGATFTEADSITENRDWFLVLSLGRSGGTQRLWTSGLRPDGSVLWQEDIAEQHFVDVDSVEPIITNVVIKLSEVIEKVEGYISEEG